MGDQQQPPQQLKQQPLQQPQQQLAAAQNVPPPHRSGKHEQDGWTYIRKKNSLLLMCNFTFAVNAHSVLPDCQGNQIYILSCGNQDGKVFRVPILYSDLDTLKKISSKINYFKTGFDALLHLDVAEKY